MTITSRDIKDQVELSLEDRVNEYDVNELVYAYVQEFGLTHDVEDDAYWSLVERFAL